MKYTCNNYETLCISDCNSRPNSCKSTTVFLGGNFAIEYSHVTIFSGSQVFLPVYIINSHLVKSYFLQISFIFLWLSDLFSYKPYNYSAGSRAVANFVIFFNGLLVWMSLTSSIASEAEMISFLTPLKVINSPVKVCILLTDWRETNCNIILLIIWMLLCFKCRFRLSAGDIHSW